MLRYRIVAATLIAFTVFFITACPPKIIPERERPLVAYLSAEPEELIRTLAERNRSIKGLRARGTLKYRFNYGKRDYRGTDINLLFEKPGNVYVRGRARLVGTLFVLKSDGERFWAEVPRDKKVYTGTVRYAPRLEGKEQIWEGLNPVVLAESLLLDDLSDYKVVCATYPNRYIISLLQETSSGKLTLKREIEFERERLRVTRHVVFGEGGEVVTEAYLYRYEETAGVELPRLLVIRRHWEELNLRLEFEDVVLNPDANENLFRYEVPQGFEVVDLDER